MSNRILIIGAGGHGKVVFDAIIAQGIYEISGFVDSTIPVGTIIVNSVKVIAHQDELSSLDGKSDFCVVAIGNNKVRCKVAELAKLKFKAATVIHPSAVIGSDVLIKEGTVVLANAVVNASCTIGENAIVNAGVVVDHDCTIGDNVHLSIGTMIGSNSKIANFKTTAIGEKINSFSLME